MIPEPEQPRRVRGPSAGVILVFLAGALLGAAGLWWSGSQKRRVNAALTNLGTTTVALGRSGRNLTLKVHLGTYPQCGADAIGVLRSLRKNRRNVRYLLTVEDPSPTGKGARVLARLSLPKSLVSRKTYVLKLPAAWPTKPRAFVVYTCTDFAHTNRCGGKSGFGSGVFMQAAGKVPDQILSYHWFTVVDAQAVFVRFSGWDGGIRERLISWYKHALGLTSSKLLHGELEKTKRLIALTTNDGYTFSGGARLDIQFSRRDPAACAIRPPNSR